MATYKDIQADIKKQFSITVKTCWIAHVKEINGLSPRVAPNRLCPTERRYPCPENVRPLIEASMKRFGMINY